MNTVHTMNPVDAMHTMNAMDSMHAVNPLQCHRRPLFGLHENCACACPFAEAHSCAARPF